MTRWMKESVIVRALILEERHDTPPCIVLTQSVYGGVEIMLTLTTLGGSRSDELLLPGSEVSLASWVSSTFVFGTRLLTLSVLNGFPDTIAFSNFCTSSDQVMASIS
jgi:hypothetical protein